MRTKIIILLALVTAFIGRAQISTIDTTNVSYTYLTNTVTAGGLTVPGFFTNQPYSTVNNSNKNIGDLNPVAWGKVNGNFAVLAGFTNSLNTNSATADGQIPVRSNGVAGGYTWIQMPTIGTGGITNLVPTNAAVPSVSGGTGFIPTNSSGGSSANSIASQNGNGTNTTLVQGVSVATTNLSVIGQTWLNNSNLLISFQLGGVGIIPQMTSSNTPSGLVYWFPNTIGPGGWSADPSKAFSTGFPTNGGQSFNNETDWIAYDFGSNITASGSSFISLETQVVSNFTLQYSSDNSIWITAISSNLPSGKAPNYYVTNNLSFEPAYARYWRWFFNPNAWFGGGFNVYIYNIQLYSPPGNIFNSQTLPLSIMVTNGLMLNTNSLSANTDGTTSILNENGSMNNTGGYYVNGVPIGQIAGVSTNTGTGTTNTGTTGTTFDPATVNYFSGCDATFSTNYNGYTHSTFFSTLPNYFTYNPLPTGDFFFVYPLEKLGQNWDGSPTVTIIGYEYVLYTPNGNVSTNAPATPIQTLNAVNDLVLNLKSAGLWASLTNYAVYPLADAAPGCNANNLMGPNFTLLWNGTLVSTNAHTAYGVSNYNGWADTQFKATSATNLTLVAFVMASGSSPTNYLISAYDGTNYVDLALAGTNLLESVGATNQGVRAYLNLTNDFFAVTRQNGTTETGLIDATNVYTRTVALNGVSGSNIVLFAQSPGFNMATNLILGFAMIGPALTANQMATLQNVVSQYEYEMGRLSGGQISTNTLAASTSYMTASNVLAAISATNTATLTTVTGLVMGVSNNLTGLTTNIQFTDTAVFGGRTNTLYFTNGILRAVTTP